MDNQIVRELFTNTIEAADILGLDSAFAGELATKRARLMPTTIGRDGRIMECSNPTKRLNLIIAMCLISMDCIRAMRYHGAYT